MPLYWQKTSFRLMNFTQVAFHFSVHTSQHTLVSRKAFLHSFNVVRKSQPKGACYAAKLKKFACRATEPNLAAILFVNFQYSKTSNTSNDKTALRIKWNSKHHSRSIRSSKYSHTSNLSPDFFFSVGIIGSSRVNCLYCCVSRYPHIGL